MKQPNNRSIKRDLLRWLLVPLCSLCAVSSAVAYYLASSFANDAYDRNLINTADSVAARIRLDEGGKVVLDLPPAAQSILRHTNPEDESYYQVLAPDLTALAGDPLPAHPHHVDSNIPRLRYDVFNGKQVRIARIRLPMHDYPDQIVLVQAAETLNSRKHLTHQILISILIPQLLLVLFGTAAVSYGVRRGLEPLADLRHAVAKRSKEDLEPLDESIAPLEAQPLAIAINDLLSRLRADLEAQRRFVANAAHQLRTPLAGIQTYVEIVERMQSVDRSRELLRQIDKGIDRMSHLVTRLLALAKAEPHSVSSFGKVDLNQIASEATSELIPIALDKDIELELDTPDCPSIIHGDGANLKELCANLVENAILYTPPGGRVCAGVTVGDGITLFVEDTGPGIPPEMRERVFERFYRVLGTGVEGSGLGLAIVREIATAHNAEITVTEGVQGKGTKIKVKFPPIHS